MRNIFLILMILLAGCSRAERAEIGAWGDQADVTCWSGGEIIYQSTTTGVPRYNESGVKFMNMDGKLVVAYADCIFEVKQ